MFERDLVAKGCKTYKHCVIAIIVRIWILNLSVSDPSACLVKISHDFYLHAIWIGWGAMRDIGMTYFRRRFNAAEGRRLWRMKFVMVLKIFPFLLDFKCLSIWPIKVDGFDVRDSDDM